MSTNNKNYKSTEEQRQIAKEYYWAHREEILEKQRALNKHSNAKHNTLIEFYQDWNLYIIERLQSPKRLPKWIKHFMILQIQRNNDRINQLEQNGKTSNN